MIIPQSLTSCSAFSCCSWVRISSDSWARCLNCSSSDVAATSELANLPSSS